MAQPRISRLVLPLLGALMVEAGLLTLADWQYHRYQQRIREQAARAAVPQMALHGRSTKFAWLTNQPNPADDEGRPGRRLIAALQTVSDTLIVDLGWQPNPPVSTAAPDFAPYQTLGMLDITGIEQPLPHRRGWLQGPVTTTHPQLLAFLEPTALTSATVPATYIAATHVSPTLPGVAPLPPALKNPLMHASYALQWLGMALAFPVLCIAFIRRRK